jgi:hypothetical protein
MHVAGVAELVDALDLGSSDESCGGSSPSARTKRCQRLRKIYTGRFRKGMGRRTTDAAALLRVEYFQCPAAAPDQAGRR